jgi:peptidoglycan-associated lipoprotein
VRRSKLRTFLKSLCVISLLAIFSLGGCSKKVVKEDTKIDDKKKTTSTDKEKHKAITGSSFLKNMKKEKSLNSEVLTGSLKSIKSEKSDSELEKEAIAEQKKLAELQKVYFDYDRSDIKDDAKSTLITNADIIKSKKSSDILIEGYCDERGTEEYNLALGQRRAESVKKYLISLGLSQNTTMTTISYGEAKPEAYGSNESAWKLNRRAVLKEIKE